MESQLIHWLPTFGWFAINIGIPVIGPLFLLWLVGLPPPTAPLATHATLTDQEEKNEKIRKTETDRRTAADKGL